MVRSLIRVGPTWSHYDIKRSLIWGIRSLMNMGKSVNERERRGEFGLFTSSLVETGRVSMAPLLEKLVLIPPLHVMVFSLFVCLFFPLSQELLKRVVMVRLAHLDRRSSSMTWHLRWQRGRSTCGRRSEKKPSSSTPPASPSSPTSGASPSTPSSTELSITW